MVLVINHNLMAMNAARNLGNSYNSLSTSVARLSSGLRINSAADDAAGLAVREMMRTDIQVLNQGVRNANDAMSLIQTADGALSVTDEKLTRMKELAEQAATGTYTSAQRLIMDSEYQAMASEVTRIAMATNFNGVKLLDGSLSGSALDGSQQMKIHFGTGNSSAEDYYYIKIGNATASAFGLGNNASRNPCRLHHQHPVCRAGCPDWPRCRIPPRTPSGRAWGQCPTACPTPSPTLPSRRRTSRRRNPKSPTWTWLPR